MLGEWLDSMVWKGFSKQNNSMILFYDSMTQSLQTMLYRLGHWTNCVTSSHFPPRASGTRFNFKTSQSTEKSHCGCRGTWECKSQWLAGLWQGKGNIPWSASSEVRLAGQHSAWIEKRLPAWGRKDRDILGGLSPSIIPASMRNRRISEHAAGCSKAQLGT